MRIIVITLAILMAGCSNYDSCYDKNFKAFYDAHEGEWDIDVNFDKDPWETTKVWVPWSSTKRKWEADQYASGQCRNIT